MSFIVSVLFCVIQTEVKEPYQFLISSMEYYQVAKRSFSTVKRDGLERGGFLDGERV